ncbi:MAG TPA: hypothetical protein VFN38_04925, partial [Gemmatimonadaceae bacterium]|nr:hypothetical protein [Gemmatimonadaceae bacterium]
MRLRTLGELCLASDEGVPLLRGRRRELVLLAYLARRTPRAVSRADLATLFWHDRPAERARLSLRQTLFKLRQLIPSGLEVTPEQVRLDPAAVSVDVARLEHASAAGEHQLALRELGGEFLPEAEDAGGEEWRLWL